MKMLSVALKDLLVLSKDRGALTLLFLLPLIFVLMWTGLATLSSGGDSAELVTLPVANLDADGAQSRALLDGLERQGSVRTQLYNEAEGNAQLEAGKLHYLLIIPTGFSADVEAGRQVTLQLWTHPDASATNAEAVMRAVSGAARDVALQEQIIASLEQLGAMQASTPKELQAFTAQAAIAQAEKQFATASTRPLVEVVQRTPAKTKEVQSSLILLSVPGFAVLFVFLAAQATASSIYEEKKLGSFRRLLAAPMSRASLLAGKMLANLVTALAQLAVIFAMSVFLLPILGIGRLSLGRDPLALLLVSLLLALCSTGLGILIAAIAQTEGQVGGISSVALWISAAIGGSFMPTYLMSGTIGSLAKIVPHYWANKAFNDVLARGYFLADLTTPLLVLAGFTVAFFAIGLWRFDYD